MEYKSLWVRLESSAREQTTLETKSMPPHPAERNPLLVLKVKFSLIAYPSPLVFFLNQFNYFFCVCMYVLSCVCRYVWISEGNFCMSPPAIMSVAWETKLGLSGLAASQPEPPLPTEPPSWPPPLLAFLSSVNHNSYRTRPMSSLCLSERNVHWVKWTNKADKQCFKDYFLFWL